MDSLKKPIVDIITIFSISMLLVSIFYLGLTVSNFPTSYAQISNGKVFVMYAASLIKTFEETLGPYFQKETGYFYDGEPRGSVQIANMIIDGLRAPDIGSAEMVIAYSPDSNFSSPLLGA